MKLLLTDITNKKEIIRNKKIEHIDQIYNLASLASPIHYQSNPIQTTKTAVIGAYNMLELAHQHNSVILQESTSEVYGDPETHPQKEEYWGNVNPVGIRSCYDEGKRCAESLFFDFWREKGVKIKVARIFNTFGPKMQENDGRVVSNFIVQALSNKSLTIYGNGKQTRSFCYVDDLMDGLVGLMNSNYSNPINLLPDFLDIKPTLPSLINGSSTQFNLKLLDFNILPITS